ncbi:MAG TPA: glycosyltransferase family 4 protein [Chloroflexota bacterium]
MTVRLLAVHYGGGLGGAPVSLLKLLAALDRSEFEPRALFTQSGEILGLARDLGVPAEVVGTGGALFYSAHARLDPRGVARFLRTFPSGVRTARAALRRLRPDLLQLNTSVLLAWAAAARRERVPTVWVVREVLGPDAWLRGWQARFILSHARRVVAISDAVARCFPEPVDRVYNAVDLSEFRLDLLERAADVRAELGIPPDAQVIMAIGSVQRPKGHWLLLDAFGALPPSTRLVMLTGGVPSAYAGSLRGRLKRTLGVPLDNLDALLRDARQRGLDRRIHVTGFRTDVARLLAAADVLVFPSLEPEGFGRPIIEAMALARPVVATDVGPSAELLGETGRLVPPDATSLAGAVSELLGAPDQRSRLGRAGRARVEQCFALERQVAAMSAIYRGALSIG